MSNYKDSEKSYKISSFKKRKKEYLKEERQSVRRQRKQLQRLRWKRMHFMGSFREMMIEIKQVRKERRRLRMKTSHIRKKVRHDKIINVRKQIYKFLTRPFRLRRSSREEKILRSHVKLDIREQRRKFIINLPSLLSDNTRTFYNHQKNKLLEVREKFNYSIAPLTRRENSRELRYDLMKMALNSMVVYVLAFWVVYFSSQLSSIMTARYFNIPAILYSYITDWPLFIYSPLYTRKALILIFGMGPLLCLLLSMLFLRVFKAAYKTRPKLKIFLVWLVFHGFNMFFGAYISGVITRTGLVYSSAWLFISQPFDIEEVVFLILSVIILIAGGFALTRYFIMAAYTQRIINPHIRIYYMISTVLIPYLTGSLLIIATNFPFYPLNFVLLQGFSILLIIPTLIHYNSPVNQQLKLHLPASNVKLDWTFVLILMLVTTFVRFYIYPGIYFD